MVYGYVRVSTNEQSIDSQKNIISRFIVDKKWAIDKWIELEISSKASKEKRRIDELLEKLNPGDVVIASELSRIGRSIKEVLNIIGTIIEEKSCRLIFVKQNLDIDPTNKEDITTKILITIFSMIAELERDFISQRTKEGLLARKAKGIKLGKPKGTIQSSIYDKDRERIFNLYELGVPISKIIDTHLKYGKYLSLKYFIEKRYEPETSSKKKAKN